jgi:hypothetical protein
MPTAQQQFALLLDPQGAVGGDPESNRCIASAPAEAASVPYIPVRQPSRSATDPGVPAAAPGSGLF